MISNPLLTGSVVLIILASAFGGLQTMRLKSAQLELVKEQQACSKMREDLFARAAAMELEARKRETALQERVDATRFKIGVVLRQVRDQEAAIRSVRADTKRMQGDLAAYAGGDNLPSDSLSSCRDRARTLAEITTDCTAFGGRVLDAYRACAKAHDSRASEVMACVEGWPK